MASVTFDTVVGGDGSTVTDDDNATTGLGNGGALIRLVPMMAQVVAVANAVVVDAGTAGTDATAAAASAADALVSANNAANSAATLTATSTTSTLIGTGAKTFTTQSGKQFQAGQTLKIVSQANSANFMIGTVTSYTTTSLVVNVAAVGGSGTIQPWNISLTGIKGDTGATGAAGSVNSGASTNINGIVKGNGSTLSVAAALDINSIVTSSRTSNTILGVADNSTLIDITSGTFTQTLTAAATLGSGWFCYIKNSGTGFITIDPNSSETISYNGNSLTTWVLWTNETVLLVCTGTGFVMTQISSGFTSQTISSSVASVSFATGLNYRKKLRAYFLDGVISANGVNLRMLVNGVLNRQGYYRAVSGGTYTASTTNGDITPAMSANQTGDAQTRFCIDFSFTPNGGTAKFYGYTENASPFEGAFEYNGNTDVVESAINSIAFSLSSGNITNGKFFLMEV
jgi:hypothetical protein